MGRLPQKETTCSKDRFPAEPTPQGLTVRATNWKDPLFASGKDSLRSGFPKDSVEQLSDKRRSGPNNQGIRTGSQLEDLGRPECATSQPRADEGRQPEEFLGNKEHF